jgi:hypothetical protein
MSFVKWCPTQHALPKSAILTDMVSKAASVACSSSDFEDVALDLSRLMPDMSLVRRSLDHVLAPWERTLMRHLRSLFPLLLHVVFATGCF